MAGSMSLALAARDLTDLEIRQRIADWVEFYRRSNHMTQADLARKLGKREGTVSRVLNAKRGAGPDVWPLLRIKLHMDINMMLDRAAPAMPEDRPLRAVAEPRSARGVGISPKSESEPIAASSRTPANRSGSGR